MLSAPADDYGLMALDAIRKLVRVLGESARLAQGQTGITGAQLFVLRVLSDHPGLSINELAERTMTHQSSVSAVVSRLVESGLVTRSPAPDDRRRQLVTMTPRGRALHRTAPAVAQEILVEALRALAPERRRALAMSLRALTDALGVSEQTAPMFFEEDDRHRSAATRRRRSSVNDHA